MPSLPPLAGIFNSRATAAAAAHKSRYQAALGQCPA